MGIASSMHDKVNNGIHLTERKGHPKDLLRIVCAGCTEAFYILIHRNRHLTCCPFCGEKFNENKTNKT